MELSIEAERPAKRVRSSGAFRQGSMDETLAPAPAQFSLQQDPFILPRPWSPSSAGPSTSFSSTTTSTTTSTLDHLTPTGSSPGEQQQSFSLVPPLTNGGLQDMDADAAPAVPADSAGAVGASPSLTPKAESQHSTTPEQLASQSPGPEVVNGTGASPIASSSASPSDQVVSSTVAQLAELPDNPKLRTPFRDCLGTYGKFDLHAFHRPDDGFVDSYIKVKWTSKQGRLSQSPKLLQADDIARAVVPRVWYIPHDPNAVTSPPDNVDDMSIGPRRPAPRLVPNQFGHPAKMELSDRRLWDFYIKNWCPGRSILGKSNLWLNEFASMQESEGVRAAIQCLAGTYVYDYCPTLDLARRINGLFEIAEHELSVLLNRFALVDVLTERESNELVAIASMLSMQDVVVFERRVKGRHPRWWIGFSQAVQCLKASDTGQRWWNRTNMQVSSLRVAQSIVVCRAIIISQPMMELTKPEDFMPVEEIQRYEWLLDDTPEGMLEIQGGCGFSKKLLVVFNNITHLAAMMLQEPRNFSTPMSIQYQLRKLQSMKQWSRETDNFQDVSEQPQHIEWIRQVAWEYRIKNIRDMTNVTAECWRIAAILYLQCRALRLPRNHEDVLSNLDDLTRCIRVMPTSGSCFTAQAPLFPVFLLGVLATQHHHLDISRQWFDLVVKAPVRSSVPPLYDALKRIWKWIGKEVPLGSTAVSPSIGERSPWWEKLVARVRKEEGGILCLT